MKVYEMSTKKLKTNYMVVVGYGKGNAEIFGTARERIKYVQEVQLGAVENEREVFEYIW